MATQAQVRANKQNAKKSTGPRSDYGKSVAAQNALKHGILSQQLVIGNESQEHFELFLNDILQEFSPRDQVERELVERIGYSMWKQRRVRMADSASAKLAMRPEVILLGINQAIAIQQHTDRFKLSDFSQTSIERYEELKGLLATLDQIDYKTQSQDILGLEKQYPTIKFYLKTMAQEADSDYSVIKHSPVRVFDLLEKLESRVREILAKEDKGYRALQIKKLMEDVNQIPRDAANQYLARYQVQLDNEINKAMDALRKHREWKMQFMDVVEDVTEADTDAANESELVAA